MYNQLQETKMLEYQRDLGGGFIELFCKYTREYVMDIGLYQLNSVFQSWSVHK